MTTPELTKQEIYAQVHSASDCILKHLFTAPIYIHETIQATQEKGLDITAIVQAYEDSVELSRKALSLLFPDIDCASKTIHELWGAIGWLNGAEHHMEQKFAEFTEEKDGKRVLKKGVSPELEPFIMALPTLMQATRGLRRNIERYSFQDIVSARLKQKENSH